MTLQIFLPCYFGNEITNASSKLSAALFHSKWTTGDESMMKIMKVFMENTKKEMKISVLGVFDLNLSTFSKIINSAYSLYAILKQIKN